MTARSTRWLWALVLSILWCGSASASERCGLGYKDANGKMGLHMPESWSPSASMEGQPLQLPPDAPDGVVFVQCRRDALAPVRDDYRFLAAELPLFIATKERMGVLEISEGKVHFRMLEGEMTDAEAKGLRDALDAIALRLNEER